MMASHVHIAVCLQFHSNHLPRRVFEAYAVAMKPTSPGRTPPEIAILGTCIIAFLLGSGQTSNCAPASVPDSQIAAGGKLSFEVASIHLNESENFTPPNFPLSPEDAYRPTGGRFNAQFALITYIPFPYKLTLTPDQRQSLLSQLPKWVATDRFSIEAKAPIDNPTKTRCG
jgi:hypothetical protein